MKLTENALDIFKNIATDSGSISISVDSANDTLTIVGAGSLKTIGFANTVQLTTMFTHLL